MTARRIAGCLLLVAACGRHTSTAYDARGTVEVPEIDVGSMVAARVVTIRVEEGAQVHAGDTIATMKQIDLGAQLAAQSARVAGATANLKDLEAGARPEEIRRAQAQVEAAAAELELRTKDLTRMRELASRDVVSKQTLDNAVTTERVARGQMQSAEAALRLLKAGSRPDQVAAGRAEVASAKASLAQLEARASDLVLIATVSGIVLSRNAEPGEGLAPNVPVVTVGEMARPYVRVYIPQSLATTLVVGSAASVTTEDGKTVPGRVVAINPRAEFTPRVALTEQERADLMFGVKVAFTNPKEAPHPGIWVTVRLSGAPTAPAGDSAR